MVKVLLVAASLAMLACCVASAWAGPVDPTSSDKQAAVAVAESGPSAAWRALDPVPGAGTAEPSYLGTVTAAGFAPVSLSATYEVASAPKLTPEDAALVSPTATQPAVIPLPAPLYATAALLALLVACRRILFRTC